MTEVDMDKRFETIETQLDEIRGMLTSIQETIVKADSTISTVAAQVMPTIEDLMKSPIIKMLGMKK